MDINIPSTAAEQSVSINKMQRLGICRNDCSRKVRQRTQHRRAPSQVAQGDFADDERMRQNHPRID
jgi:hypothetical protein